MIDIATLGRLASPEGFLAIDGYGLTPILKPLTEPVNPFVIDGQIISTGLNVFLRPLCIGETSDDPNATLVLVVNEEPGRCTRLAVRPLEK